MLLRKRANQAGNAKQNNILGGPAINMILQAACWVLLAGVSLHLLQTPRAGSVILAEVILITILIMFDRNLKLYVYFTWVLLLACTERQGSPEACPLPLGSQGTPSSYNVKWECFHLKYAVCHFKCGLPVCSEKFVLLVFILKLVGYRKDLELLTCILTRQKYIIFFLLNIRSHWNQSMERWGREVANFYGIMDLYVLNQGNCLH